MPQSAPPPAQQAARKQTLTRQLHQCCAKRVSQVWGMSGHPLRTQGAVVRFPDRPGLPTRLSHGTPSGCFRKSSFTPRGSGGCQPTHLLKHRSIFVLQGEASRTIGSNTCHSWGWKSRPMPHHRSIGRRHAARHEHLIGDWRGAAGGDPVSLNSTIIRAASG